MAGAMLRRLGEAAAVVLVAATITFALLHLAPGDPLTVSLEHPGLTAAVRERMREVYGLDRTLAEQYLRYLSAVARGDLGQSLSLRRPVAAVLADALPNTLLLMGATLALSFALGIALGVYQALRRGSIADRLLGGVSLAFYSLPDFWLALMAVLIFAYWVPVLPAGGAVDAVLHEYLGTTGRLADRLRHLALPALTLTLLSAAGIARFQRAAMLDAMHEDFVRTAHAKGVAPRAVVWRHLLRNALAPTIAQLGMSLPALVGGAAVVEKVFSWPGLGLLAVNAIATRDYALVTGAVIVASAAVALGSLAADGLHGLVDPRVRGRAGAPHELRVSGPRGVDDGAERAARGAPPANNRAGGAPPAVTASPRWAPDSRAAAARTPGSAESRTATTGINAGPPAAVGPWRLAARRLAGDRGAVGALVLLAVLAAVAVLAPWITPYDPAAQPDIVGLKSRPPSPAHPFGTDPLSRDVLSRVLDGARVSLAVALASVALSSVLGTAYGCAAGMAGPRVDAALTRLVDALAAVPRVLLLIAVLSLWGALPLVALVALIGGTGWFATSRLVRAEVRAVRNRDFLVAAAALGAPGRRILLHHVLPNVLSPVVVAAALGVGNVIALEAALAYLGIGVQPPHASWGNIIQDGATEIARLWWMSLFPGLAVAITVMAVTRLGDGLRDALDVRGRDG